MWQRFIGKHCILAHNALIGDTTKLKFLWELMCHHKLDIRHQFNNTTIDFAFHSQYRQRKTYYLNF